MFDRKLILATCAAASLSVAFAQTPAKPVPAAAPQTPASVTPSKATVPDGGMPAWIKPETPERRMERLGTHTDPGINPDPSVHFWRFGKSYHIERFDRKWAAYDAGDNNVRPMANVNFAFEIYQQNEKYVWVWVTDPEPQDAADVPTANVPASKYSQSDLKFFNILRPQFFSLEPAKNG